MKQAYIVGQLVILFVVVLHVMTVPIAKGDDCACVASSAGDQITSLAPVSLTATDAASTSLFLVALNSERSRLNLQPVIGKLTLEAIASQNNAAMTVHGTLGHWITGGAGQCAAGPFATMAQALQAWLHSPAHRALILAPDLSEVGYHQSGPWHTVSTWQGGARDLDPTDRNDARNYTFGPVASYGSPMVFVGQTKIVESKPAAGLASLKSPEGFAPACPQCATSVPGSSTGSQCNQAIRSIESAGEPRYCGSPGRRGFHPFARLLSRLRVSVQIGVQF